MWRWVRLVAAVALCAAIVARLGAAPVLDGISRIQPWALAAALALGVLTTLCASARWVLVSRSLGLDLPWRTAVAGYYRSQLLNATLPSGVLGDVHRGVAQGRGAGEVSRGVRAVVWERSIGQLTQLTVAGSALLVLGFPGIAVPRRYAVLGLLVVAVAGLSGLLVRRRRAGSRAGSLHRSELRTVLSLRRWPLLLAVSGIAVLGHVGTFLVAARSAGAQAGLAQLAPIALAVLLASSVPLSVAGWGPREGAAVWAFGAAGLGSANGASTAVVFGVLVLVATLPGVAVLVTTAVRSRRRSNRSGRQTVTSVLVPAGAAGCA